MKNQFVTYEIALKLKELGFDEECFAYWYGEGDLIYCNSSSNGVYPFKTQRDDDDSATAPLWQQVEQWFRVKYNICVVIQCVNWRLGKQFEGYLCKFQTKEMIDKGDYSKYIYLSDLFITYEETREYIILKAIELCQNKE